MHMMHIGNMRMLVSHELVAMVMGVWFPRRIARQMGMPMMLIVHVRVRVLLYFMLMQVPVIFRQVKPDTQRH